MHGKRQLENGGAVMKMTPSPIGKKGERNIYCPNYGDCLDHAVENKWRAWSCAECSCKLLQEATQAVRTVSDSNVLYELPPNFAQDVWQRWG